MARGRFRATRGARRGFRPPTDWAATTLVGSLTAGVGGTDTDWWNLSAIEEDEPGDAELSGPQTLRRTRGVWHAYPVTWPNNSSGIVECAIGIGVTNGEAIAANATPTPIDDSFWDGWIIRRWCYWRLPTPVGGANSFAIGAGSTLDRTDTGVDAVWNLDSRAMRRIEDNQLFLVVDLATDTGEAVVVNYVVDLRQLWSLSGKR